MTTKVRLSYRRDAFGEGFWAIYTKQSYWPFWRLFGYSTSIEDAKEVAKKLLAGDLVLDLETAFPKETK